MPAPPTHDAFIFGGGLAGTMLAERLLAAGKRVLLVDDPAKSRCSRVAAGIVNPIGGKRLKRVWLADTLLPHALAYYQTLEARYQSKLFHPRPIARLFANDAERQIWKTKRAADPSYQALTQPLSTLDLPSPFAGDDGFAIPLAGYLDTEALLDTLRSAMQENETLLASSFHYEQIEVGERSVRFRNYRACYAVFAEGHLATRNPWFNFAPFKPAKGIIASIETEPRLDPQGPLVLKQKFLLPRHDGRTLVGATYNWDDATDAPDAAGIQELERFLNAHLGPDKWLFESIRAGVRPATAGAYPIVGPHPERSRLLSFNGFGSKGALQIPFFAQSLVDHLYQQKELAPEVLPARFLKKAPRPTKRWLAVNIAREAVQPRIQPGDTAIDATAGNGHDTLWLCQAVGENGRVFAFDIQDAALATTRQRLENAHLAHRATLLRRSHDTLLDSLPDTQLGTVAAMVFNLGFLPGGDPAVITRAATTLAAMQAGLQLLKRGGILSVTLYPGHPGGCEEADRVLDWLAALPTAQFEMRAERHPQNNPASPFPVFAIKR